MPQTQDNSRNRWVDRVSPEELLRILEVHGFMGLVSDGAECGGKLNIHTAISCHLFHSMHMLS